MKPIVKLSDIVEKIEMASDGDESFYNALTGEFGYLLDLGDHAENEAFFDRLDSEGGWACLPSQRDANEYEMMSDFAAAVKNSKKREQLEIALSGKGAFRRFKDAVIREDVEEAWYAFRDRRYLDFARDWCDENEIPYDKSELQSENAEASANEAENELYLEITDDYSLVTEFDTGFDYREAAENKRVFTLQISVKSDSETVAYLECFIFLDAKAAEQDSSLVQVADDELNDDVYEAMRILDEQGLLDRDEKSNLYFVLAHWPISTVYLHHLVVREDYRKQGLGGWLLRSLPDILDVHCKVSPNVIIVKVYPESVSWKFDSPSFTADLGDPDENGAMFRVMRELIESCGYVRQENSFFFIKDFAL
jgi:GNAT superfamily N-acetyltransferase